MDPADLMRRFTFHPATDPVTQSAHSAIRRACHRAAIRVDQLVPDSREKSLAITALEQAMFWANGGVARLGTTAEDEVDPDLDPAPGPITTAAEAQALMDDVSAALRGESREWDHTVEEQDAIDDAIRHVLATRLGLVRPPLQGNAAPAS